MRRRIGGMDGLCIGGNSSPSLVDCKSTGDKETDAILKACAKAAYETWFEKEGYCDAGINGPEVRFGIEPSYMYEDLKLICIHKEKGLSRLWTGIAWGPWGSGVASKEKFYKDYKNTSKFTRFIDEWHPKIYKSNA